MQENKRKAQMGIELDKDSPTLLLYVSKDSICRKTSQIAGPDIG